MCHRGAGDLGPLDFIHRKIAADEFYFVTNKTQDAQALTCRFRVADANGLVPEFWRPDSGRRSACHDWKSLPGGQTELLVELGPLGSVFVVFRKAKDALDPISRDTFKVAKSPAPLVIDGPWQVGFPEGWGAPRETTFDSLQSWTESENEDIRFFLIRGVEFEADVPITWPGGQ